MAEIIKNYDNGSSVKVVYSYTQDVAKNQSTITMTLYVKRDAYGPSWNTKCNAYIQLDGAKVMTYTSSFNIGSSWVKIGSTVSKTITHGADGTKTVTIKGFFDSLGLTSKLEDLTASGSVNLTTIPRASSFTLSASTITAGSTNMTVNITRASSSFTHTVQWKFGNHTQSNTGVATSSAYTIPASWLDAIPNSASGTGTVTVITYSGGAEIGKSSKNFTVQASSAVLPAFTGITFTRIDGTVPTDWGIYVKTKSKVKVAISGAAGVYGSTIKSYSISGGGYSGTASSLTTGFLNTAGTVTFTAKITDSRGRTATKTASITVVDYSASTITSVSAYRCNASGSAQDDGTYVALTAKFSGASVSGKNTISGKYRYMANGGAWSGLTALTSGTKKVVSGISAESTYTFEVQVSDAFTTISKQVTVNSAEFIMDFKAGGDGIAFGKSAEESDTLDVAWIAKFRKNIHIEGTASIYGADPSTKEEKLVFEPQSSLGNTVIGRDNYRKKSGDTYIYGNDIRIAAATAEQEYRPYYRKGDSIVITLHTSGYVTSGGNSMYFSVPIAREIIGNPTLTASSTTGFLVRQNNKYLYGSGYDEATGNVYAKPSSYTASYANGVLYIKAEFSNTTNVENNSTVGIYWYGRVTLS